MKINSYIDCIIKDKDMKEMKDILQMNELDNVIVANSVEEIPTLVFNENNCFNLFSVVIERDVFGVFLFEKIEERAYKLGRFLKSTNEYKMYTSERTNAIEDEELLENIMKTFPRYYHIHTRKE